jgi:hypothetical protein
MKISGVRYSKSTMDVSLGHAIAKRKRWQASGWQSILKKRLRKHSYGKFDFDLYYLDPFDNSTLLQDLDVELTMLISNIFITGPMLVFQLDADAHFHDSEKDDTDAQALISD